MKRCLLLAVLFILVYQANGQFRMGSFIAKNYQVDKSGIGINSEYFLNDKLSISADAIVYLSKFMNDNYQPNTQPTFHQADLHVNVNYFFLNIWKIGIYSAAGINLHMHRSIYEYPFEYAENSTEITPGLNTAIGVIGNIRYVKPFAEIQYTCEFVEPLAYANFTTKIGFKVSIKKKRNRNA